jgi:hypothetical protein
VLETILGGLLGGVTRLMPEALKFFDRKAERAHELALLASNLEADKARLAGQLAVASASSQQAEFTSALSALQESVKSQGVSSGVPWIDGISAMVRPTVTYVVFGMWVMVKCASLATVITHSATLADFTHAIDVWWVPNDQAMLAAILNFWFLGRVFDKALR